MTVLTQGVQTGEFLLSEANGEQSRENVTVTVAGAVALPSGTVLGKITVSGKYVKYADGASDGSQTAAAVLLEACPGTNGDYRRAVIARDAEVASAFLTGSDTNGVADLKAIGIIVR